MAQNANMMVYPVWICPNALYLSKSAPPVFVTITPPNPPAIPQIPITDAIDFLGNISETVVNKLALQA